MNVCLIGAVSDDKLRYCVRFIEPWSVVNSDECVNVCLIGALSDDKLCYCERFIEPWSMVNSDDECV